MTGWICIVDVSFGGRCEARSGMRGAIGGGELKVGCDGMIGVDADVGLLVAV